MIGWYHWEVENVIAGNIFITVYQIVETVSPYPKLNIDEP